VPAGQAPAKKKPAKAKAPLEGEDFLARMNLDEAEHEEERVCPFCATEMDEEEVVCRSCGMNVETGQMDAREAKKRARKGPDPALFYSKAWSDSFQFLKAHWGMALKTGWYLTALGVLNNICARMVFYCDGGPTKTFWCALTVLTSLGMFGWFWSLSFKVIEATMTRNDKLLERLHFDFFEVIALGLRLVIWPFVVLGPFLLPIMIALSVVGAVSLTVGGAGAANIVALLFGLGLGAFMLWFYPLATVHMTQEYTYKAWILWELLKIGLRNFGPAVYYFIIAIVSAIPVAVVLVPIALLVRGVPTATPLDEGGVIVAFLEQVTHAFNRSGLDNTFYSGNVNSVTGNITAWFLNLIGEQVLTDGWLYMLIQIPLNIIAAFLLLAPIYLVAGFPALFMMRVNGLLGYYNYERLDLVNRIYPNTPANFWVRFLAYQLDMCLWPLASLLVVKEKKAILVAWLLNAITFVTVMWLPEYILAFVVSPMWSLYNFWMYFAVSESSTTRTTIGKDAFGLIVNDLDNKQITLGKATVRVFGRWVCGLTLGLGYLFAAFHPQKRGLHDMIAGTRCCWRGDR
jgi:uncharacterized RDD family membrane protein YckC